MAVSNNLLKPSSYFM